MNPTHRLVVTLAPELQASQPATAFGRSVTVVGDVGVALEFLLNHVGCVEVVVADLGELGQHWTGMRLLKHLQRRSGFRDTSVWLMANRWDRNLLQWVVDEGGAGLVRRSSQGILEALALLELRRASGMSKRALLAALLRERSDTDALLKALSLDPAEWRGVDGGLRRSSLLATVMASACSRPM